MPLPIILTVFLAGQVLGQHDPHFKPNRSVIVHLFEWKFNDVANECERFLGPRGFGGVQLSPVNEHIIVSNEQFKRPWWERYQPMSYRIMTRSGDDEDFFHMSERCNKAGVRIYVDVVLNHMAGPNEQMKGTAGSTANVSELNYPGVPYTREDFHKSCEITNYKDAQAVRNCQLFALPDLDQSRQVVKTKIVEFLNSLVELGVAGFRVDAAKHMWPADLQAIYSMVNNLNSKFGFSEKSRPFIYQEVIDGGEEPISKTEYTGMGAVTEFQAGSQLRRIFSGNAPLSSLINWGPGMGLLPHRDALIFVDNHDNQRGHGDGGSVLTHKEPKNYQMATTFLLAHPYGIPRIMSSYYFNNSDQGPPSDENEAILSPVLFRDGDGNDDSDDSSGCVNDWVCEHRWNAIANMVEFRHVAENNTVTNWQDNGSNQIAFCRGDKAFVAFNSDPTLDYNVTVIACISPGVYCDVISGSLKDGKECSGKSLTVANDGTSKLIIPADDEFGVIAVHAKSRLK